MMKKPLIFSGTTEGRQMSERLSAAGRDHIVCVATEYGELVMQPDEHADIRQGRLDEEEMEKLIFEEASAVFDATHPYATAVSENIRAACEALDTGYVRILRDEEGADAAYGVNIFDDAASCAEALKSTEGNILLTTGSKDLAVYAADPEVRERLFARVLPSEESVKLCGEAGISGRQIIAMQGPFSCEMNKAVIRQYGISVLVTKASGAAGGYPEKLRAAHECGAETFVIGRPAPEHGVTVNEALEIFFEIKPVMRIDLIGTGPGRQGLMTGEAKEAISKADVIFGAPRMIAPYEGRETYPYYLARDIIPVLEELRPERAAVLFSGDLSKDLEKNDFPTVAFERELDLFVCEMVHFSPQTLAPYFATCRAKQVRINHFGSLEKMTETAALAKEQNYPFPIVFTNDDDTVEI
jgi:precorrin-6Y C5,15-methyltransferase (decarboxylating)